MLQQLHIENYARIDSLSLDLKAGMTVITGETGTGKSILLGALSLLLGSRADRRCATDREKKSVVEGVFAIGDCELQSRFESLDLDWDAQVVVRREIWPSGRSRAFVNDTPTTLEVLCQLGDQLLAIHAQGETQRLDDPAFQMELLDSLSENPQIRLQYKETYQAYKALEKRLAQAEAQQAKRVEARDFNRFLLAELDRAELRPGEELEWETEQKKLAHVAQIKTALEAVRHRLDAEDCGVLPQLQQARNAISQLTDWGDSFAEVAGRLDSAFIELQDLLREAEGLQAGTEHDPQRLHWIEDRLQRLFDLKRKHQVNSVAELCEVQRKITLELRELHAADAALDELRSTCQDLNRSLKQISQKLHLERIKSANLIEKSLCDTLSVLAMPDARLSIAVESTGVCNAGGSDSVGFYFSADQDGALQPLQNVASGGEKSRFMLAVKRLLADKRQMPTLVFDEIDSGVSGRVADQMGRIMKAMSRSNQLITLTHLPQVAAKGDWHLRVFKEPKGSKTLSVVKDLSEAERVEELAAMLSGRSVSQAALRQAEELLQSD